MASVATNTQCVFEEIVAKYNRIRHPQRPQGWVTEVGNPGYILDLLLSIINVSVQTVDIVEGMPEVMFGEGGKVEE